MNLSTRAAAQRHLAKLASETTASETTLTGYRSVLNRLARFAPELPVAPDVFEEYLGDPVNTSLGLRIRRYDVGRRFLKDAALELGVPDKTDDFERPRETVRAPELLRPSSAGSLDAPRIDTRAAMECHLKRLRQTDLSSETIDNYRWAIERLVEAAPTLPATDDQIFEALGDPADYASSTRRLHYEGLSGFFHSPKMTKAGLSGSLDNIPKPKRSKTRKQICTPEEAVRLVAAADTDFTRALVLFLLNTGARIGEAAKLNIADVQDGFATLNGKSGIRTVPVARELENMLRELANSDGTIWSDADGERLDAKPLGSRYRTVAQRAGLPTAKCGPHVARHTFATMWLRNGGSLRALQMIMGHSSIKTTEQYLQFVQDDVVREQAKFAPTSTLGLLGGTAASGGSESAGDGVSGEEAPPAYPLMFDPVTLVQQQAERDTRALVKAATDLLQQEFCLELPSGRPPKVLPREIAAMVKDDVDAGFTRSAIVRKYKRYCRFSRTYLSDIINDGRLDEMAKTPT